VKEKWGSFLFYFNVDKLQLNGQPRKCYGFDLFIYFYDVDWNNYGWIYILHIVLYLFGRILWYLILTFSIGYYFIKYIYIYFMIIDKQLRILRYDTLKKSMYPRMILPFVFNLSITLLKINLCSIVFFIYNSIIEGRCF
jgi:hypothetical protein